MVEELVIREFGPIRDAKIKVRDLTVFVGPQATGKSIAAQILCFMRGLESFASRPVETFFDRRRPRSWDKETKSRAETDLPLEDILSAMEWWLGNELSIYTTSQTALSWNPGGAFEEKQYGIEWDKKGPRPSEDLAARTEEWLSFGRQVYIPAGRALYSFLPPASALRFLSSARGRLKWPGYIPTFYETLADALDQLWKDQERGKQLSLTEGMLDADFLQKRIDAIFKGRIRYGPDTIALKVGQQYLRPDTIAAGQMEIWPFWAIMQVSFKAYLDIVRIYFEEPEAHLHPGAQRNVMEIISYLVGQRGQFVLTTHSPYILYAINNSLMAQKVLDAGTDLPPDIPKQVALRPEQVAAYRFSEDGMVYDILDAETGLIDEDELDRVADELGASFTRLQEQLEATE